MRNLSTLSLVLVTSLAACKKKEEPAPRPAPPTGSATGSATAGSAAGSGSAEAGSAAGSGSAAAGSGSGSDSKVIKIDGFSTPESVAHDVEQDVYFVSNINGSPLGKDDNGFISKLSPDGKVLELKWIDGAKPDVTLNAPKGLAVLAGTLFVSDVDVVRMFDAKTGSPKGEIKFPGATFLNDIAVDGDKLLVSDSGIKNEKFEPSGSDAVYTFDQAGKITGAIKDAKLEGPNGVAAGGYAVTFRAKKLLKDGKLVAEAPTGGLDGLVWIEGSDGTKRVAFSSWECSCVYTGDEKGPFTVLVKDVKSPADIGWDAKRRQLLIPLFTENRVEIHKLD